MAKKTFYITTPLYYVNAEPHIGHAYTNVICDTFKRYHEFIGEKTYLLTGTDEHGTKIEKAAAEKGVSPKDFVDGMIPKFTDLWKTLGINYDHFIRTTDEPHKSSVQAVMRDLEDKGDIYKEDYKGWYCTPCESFWTDLQLAEGKCPDCKRDVQELSEQNYFFRLSNYQEWLIETIKSNDSFVLPEMRRNEILGFLREPLEDLCITRPRARLSWGIDFPTSTDHVVYVWFDALINYISAIDYKGKSGTFSELWPADMQVVGKDILRHHAVYWPIMLKAIGLELPKTILAHGWWTMQGDKVSKSRGNAVDPTVLVEKYGVDTFRYYMLREVTLGQDGAFSEDLLQERYTKDLANDLGNLWFRFASMLAKYFNKQVPDQKFEGGQACYLNLWQSVNRNMLAYNPRRALDEIWALITVSNQYVENHKPWALAKDPEKKEELARVMLELGEHIAHIAVILYSFLPETASKILQRLSLDERPCYDDHGEAFSGNLLKAGAVVERGDALFPRLEEAEQNAS